MPLTIPENLSDVKKYSGLVWKRRWTIALCVCLVLAFTAFRIFREVPWYITTASVLLETETPQAFDIENVFQKNPWGGMMNPQAMQQAMMMKMQLLNSRMLAERVIKQLRLDENPNFIQFSSFGAQHYLGKLLPEGMRKKVKVVLGMEGKPDPKKVPTETERLTPYVDNYVKRVQLNPQGLMVQVTFSGQNPSELQKILEAHLQAFVKLYLELKYETSDEAKGWISQKLEEARRNLEVAEVELRRFVNENNLTGIDSSMGRIQASPQGDNDQILRHNEELLSGYRQRAVGVGLLISALDRVQQDARNVIQLPIFEEGGQGQNLELSVFRSQYVQLSNEYNQASLTYGPDHPKIVAIRTQMEKLEEQIRKTAGVMLQGHRKNLEAINGFAASLEQKIATLKEQNDQKQMLAGRLNVLMSDVNANREAYQAILDKAKVANLMGNLQDSSLMSSIKIFDPPSPPIVAGGSDKPRKLVMAVFMGLFLGLAVVLFLEFLDNVIRTPEDVKRFFKVSFLGPFPHISTLESAPPGTPFKDNIIILKEPTSVEAEAIRNIRTNLIFSFPDRANHAILFSSPSPMEGKSTVSTHVAVSMAQLGKRTLLVDADLRRPVLHRLFGIENRQGLSDILIGQVSEEQAILPSGIPNLDLITAGTIPPSPSELLGSLSMVETLANLRGRYQIVLFDMPPILTVLDALVLGQHLNGVVLMARSGTTAIPSIKQSIEKFEERNIRILGIILNGSSLEASQYYQYYQSAETGEKEEEPLPSRKSA